MAIDIESAFEKFDDEYLKFDRIKNPPSARPDICAFILLDRLVPNAFMNMISASEHDEFFLDVTPDALARVATEDDIRDLVRCGVRYCFEYDCLSMSA